MNKGIFNNKKILLEISGISPEIFKYDKDVEQIKFTNDTQSLLYIGLTSKSLRDIIKQQVIIPSKRLALFRNFLLKCIDKKIIVPIFFSNNFDYLMLVKILKIYKYEEKIMGFYDVEHNKIFLLLNNLSISPSGLISDTNLLSLIFHELIHYIFRNYYPIYRKFFDSYLFEFYQMFFKKLFRLEIPDILIREFLESLYEFELTGEGSRWSYKLNKILEYVLCTKDKQSENIKKIKILKKLFALIEKEPDEKEGQIIIKISSVLFDNIMKEIYNILFNKIFSDIMEEEELKKRRVFNSVFYQELLASSEVIAMLVGTMIKYIYMKQKQITEDNIIFKMVSEIW